MLKALFFDMDDTLCDTLSANKMAKQLFSAACLDVVGKPFDAPKMAEEYVRCIYREWQDDEEACYMLILSTSSLRSISRQT